MRFPVPDEAWALQAPLANLGVTLKIVYMQAGQDIADEVFEWIEHADTFLVFGTQNYGEDTGNPASSCAEAKYAQNQGKRIILRFACIRDGYCHLSPLDRVRLRHPAQQQRRTHEERIW